MKINNFKIDDYCKNLNKAPFVILIYGVDYGLINERVNLLVHSFFKINNDQKSKINISDIEINYLLNNPEALEIEAKSLSLLSDKKLIKIRDANDKLVNIIEKYLLDAEASSLVILIAENLSPRSKLRKYIENHAIAAAIPCYMDDKNSILNLINLQFDKSNIKTSAKTKELFASYLGEDRQITLSEIEKAILLAGKDKTLTNKDILSYIQDSTATNIDELYDFTLSGNMEKSFKILFRVQSQGTNAIFIIRLFIRQLQILLSLKKLSNNKNIDTAINNFKPPIFFKRKDNIRKQILSLSEKKISKILNLLNSAEIYCKSTKSSPNLIIKQTILAINIVAKN